jgi:hypothetical protein
MDNVWEKVFNLLVDIILDDEESFSDEEVLQLRDAFQRIAFKLDITEDVSEED